MDSAVAGAQPAPAPQVNREELIAFHVCGEEFAFALTDVREIIKAGPMTPVPGAPASVRGIFNLRGKILTIVDLATILGLTAAHDGQPQNIVVAESGKESIGILIDTVQGVVRVPVDHVRPAPDLLKSGVGSTLLRGVVVLKQGTSERLIMVLDLSRLFSSIL